MPYYKGSWYSQLPFAGWIDPEDRPGSAAYQVGGKPIPDSQQGIALPTRGGLGKWYNVTPPGSDRPFPLQQTDLGPAKWTGRGVDISAAGAHQMGYTPNNFPTDASFKVEPIDLTGLGLAAGYGGGVPGDNTDVPTAPGPGSTRREQQGPKMPAASLMDMLSGKAPLEFSPRDVSGNQIGVGDSIAQNSNSLIGLGMGLLQPYRPGESPYAKALEGFQAGSVADSRRGYQQAQLAHQKTQDARQASQDAIMNSLREREFQRSDPATAPTEFTKAARDLGLTKDTPEYNQFAKQFFSSKSEGNLAAQFEQRRTIAERQGLDVNDPKVKNWIAAGGELNKESSPLPAETAARMAMGGKFLDEAPAIRKQIESGMATDTATGKLKTYLNMGDQGEVARKVKSGTEALLRALTGAGMGIAEAQKYVARYEIQPTDSSKGALSKFDQLQDELIRTEQEAFRGRGGVPKDIMDRRKAAHEEIAKKSATAPGPKTAPAPKAGQVEDGHVFKGGDPSDPNNWAPVR